MASARNNVVDVARQSVPVDTTIPYDSGWVAGKTIVITGGTSRFGEGFFRKWAENGANVIIGDVNNAKGKALVEGTAELSPSKGIDSVVADAGITEEILSFQEPKNLDAPEPHKPNFKAFEVDLLGVLSQKANPSTTPGPNTPDRNLLLIGSVASLAPLPGQILYAVSKHGVLGLFRTLRSTSFANGVRVNMLCPYFIDTPLIPTGDASMRLMADTRIVGRALVIGPKVRVDEELNLLPETSEEGNYKAVWEAYADDLNELEIFGSRLVRMLNSFETVRGWGGWAFDVLTALMYPIRSIFGRR
ncbi:hypothetical protein DID88_002381 [Monilinia fructigena]|uniref:Uncharacterized protein n=1 Tax=Monilinia fructigena TaxID=38457 RepID=A0A395ID99_9HELO|nr:hypothetical protein DID88_002381 [Monilinia fructigena]